MKKMSSETTGKPDSPTKTINKILILINGPQETEAVKIGAEIAENNNSEICLLHVIEPLNSYCYTYECEFFFPYFINKYLKEIENEGNHLLQLNLNLLKIIGIKASAKQDYGRKADKVVEIAKSESFDLIIVNGEKDSSFLRRIFSGSVSSKIARKSSCPVLIVKN